MAICLDNAALLRYANVCRSSAEFSVQSNHGVFRLWHASKCIVHSSGATLAGGLLSIGCVCSTAAILYASCHIRTNDTCRTTRAGSVLPRSTFKAAPALQQGYVGAGPSRSAAAHWQTAHDQHFHHRQHPAHDLGDAVLKSQQQILLSSHILSESAFDSTFVQGSPQYPGL